MRKASCFLIIILCIAIAQPVQSSANNLRNAGAFYAAAWLLSLHKNKASSHTITKKIADITNTDSADLIDATTLGLYYWAKSFLFMHGLPETNNRYSLASLQKTKIINSTLRTWAIYYRYLTIAQPLIEIASTSKTWNAFIKKIPVLKHILTCPDPYCENICDACEYRHVFRKAPFEALGNVALMHLHLQDTKNNIREQKKANAQIAAQNAVIQEYNDHLPDPDIHFNNHKKDHATECSVCLEDSSLGPVCAQAALDDTENNNHKLCLTCYSKIKHSNSCPSCRGSITPIKKKFLPLLPVDAQQRKPSTKELATSITWRIGIIAPFWTLFKKNKLFPYRWHASFTKITNPFKIAHHTTCTNKWCASICNQCKLKKIYIDNW